MGFLRFRLLILLVFCSGSMSYGAGFDVSCNQFLIEHQKASLKKPPSSEELISHVAESLKKVPEFEFIKAEAEKLGLRVWLFGGTASGFIHYVKWDLLRRRGQMDLQADRFDFDFTNIFRSTQDLDIVVDAKPEVAKKFEDILKKKFPHFLGSKENKWEVRTLNHSMGRPGVPGFKEALLNDSDFNNQNTDTNSIGMVEITDSDEPRVHDLKSWDKAQSIFLEDVIKSEISYFRSDKHFETARAKRGENPEVLSVLRLLVKAFQYELEFDDKVFRVIREISKKFDPLQIKNDVALRKIAETSTKLVMHAVNIEYAMNTLESLGLRKKLISMGNKNSKGDFSWWLNREPLRSKPLIKGRFTVLLSKGKTAKELGIEVVAHETNSFLAYESITRSHSGEPNVLISRKNGVGEMAVHGDGFYTQIGKIGARGTGLTIRFRVHPEAREGVDFRKEGDYVIFLNKKALTVIPESLNFGLEDLMELAESGAEFEVDHSDLALLEKLKRKLNASMITEELEKLLNSGKDTDHKMLVKILSTFQNSKSVSKIIPIDVINEISKKVYLKVSELSKSQDEVDILKYITIAYPIFKILSQNQILEKGDFFKTLNKFLGKDLSFEIRKEALLEILLNIDDIRKEPLFSNVDQFFTHEEQEKIKAEIKKDWLFSTDKRKKDFLFNLNEFFSEAIKVGDITKIEMLTESWLTGINFKNISDLSTLQLAAYYEKEEVIAWLIMNEDFDFKAVNLKGFTETEQLRLSGKSELADKIESRRPDARGRRDLIKDKVEKELTEGSSEEKSWWRRLFSNETNRKNTNEAVMGFVEFSPGSFLMGEDDDKKLTTLTKPFEVMSIDLTQKTYKEVTELIQKHLGDEKYKSLDPAPSQFKGEYLPVEKISYIDITLWIDGLNDLSQLNDKNIEDVLKELFPGHEQGKKIYDLPTEAQWEYVMRLGGVAEGKFSHGDNEGNLSEYAIYRDNSDGKTWSVGSKKPVYYNGQPLWDLSGNVWKWVKDWYDVRGLKGGVDPIGPNSGSYHVIRGGGWNFNTLYLQSAVRADGGPDFRGGGLGARLVRTAR